MESAPISLGYDTHRDSYVRLPHALAEFYYRDFGITLRPVSFPTHLWVYWGRTLDGVWKGDIFKYYFHGSEADRWYHIAWQRSAASGKCRYFRDGVMEVGRDQPGTAINVDGNRLWLCNCPNNAGFMDELRVSDIARYDAGGFSPHRFEQGSCILSHDFGDPQKLSQIEWTAVETGENEGDISKIEVYNCDSDQWVQVGGANPTSPISDLAIRVCDGTTDIIRATLDPKGDDLQSETPKLTGLDITYSSVGRAYRPFILRGGRLR